MQVIEQSSEDVMLQLAGSEWQNRTAALGVFKNKGWMELRDNDEQERLYILHAVQCPEEPKVDVRVTINLRYGLPVLWA